MRAGGVPMAGASPWTTLRTPEGIPALRPSSAIARAVRGVSSAGLSTTCGRTGRLRFPTGSALRRAEEVGGGR